MKTIGTIRLVFAAVFLFQIIRSSIYRYFGDPIGNVAYVLVALASLLYIVYQIWEGLSEWRTSLRKPEKALRIFGITFGIILFFALSLVALRTTRWTLLNALHTGLFNLTIALLIVIDFINRKRGNGQNRDRSNLPIDQLPEF